MVVSEIGTGSGQCGWATCPVRQALLPFEDVALKTESEWVASRAQQQLHWDTLQSIKEKAAHAFLPVDPSQPVDPFRETYSDGGLYGSGCNYTVGFYGIQGRQPKCEDYVLHLALGPDLFAPFDDCTRACLACVFDGHGGTGAVQYVAERFPSYLLDDLPRLRSKPAVAMRAALHRIDEELTTLGHNSGTTVNALMLINNRISVVNTGDCRCILYDWVDERTVQVTHDHNLLSTRERERVLGEGAELSGCGGYVVLQCPADGAKLLGVTKALGHAGVKALQRSLTMSSLTGILEAELSGPLPPVRPGKESPSGRRQQSQQAHVQMPGHHQKDEQQLHEQMNGGGGDASRISSASDVSAGTAPGAAGTDASSTLSSNSLWSSRGPFAEAAMADNGGTTNGGGGPSSSGMSEDMMALPTPRDCDMSSSCSGLRDDCVAGLVEVEAACGPPLCPLVAALDSDRATSRLGTDVCPSAAAAAAAAVTGTMTCVPAPHPLAQRCRSSTAMLPQQGHHQAQLPAQLVPEQQQQPQPLSMFATPAAAQTLLAAVAELQPRTASGSAAVECPAEPSASLPPLTGMGTSGGFVLSCEPDEFEFTVEDDRHLVLLGCDGVFDRMGNAEACKTALRQLTASNSCVDAAREVTHRACRLGSGDNITALVLRFGRKPIIRRQSFSVLSMRRSSSNTSSDLAASGGSITSRS